MSFELFMYVVLCFAVGLMWLESIGYKNKCWRWSIADLLKLTMLISAMLAFGRMLALADR